MGRTLVLYTFFEWNARVEYFLEHGTIADPNVDFVIICNHPTLKPKNPLPACVKHYMNRQNIGFDFGAWSDALFQFSDEATLYDYFIFVNASVWGPIVPPYYEKHWTELFIQPLRENRVQLFGCTINTQPNPHVQSYVFAMNIDTLDLLCEEGILSVTQYEPTKRDTIKNRELRMSQVVLANEGNIGCLMSHYRHVDFHNLHTQTHPPLLGDVAFAKGYYGETLHPYEVLFIKATRNISNRWLRSYLEGPR